MANDTYLTTTVPAKIAAQFQRIAKANDRPVSAELRRLVKEHVEREARNGR